MLVCACSFASVVSDSLRSHGLQSTKLLCPWDSPGKNTGVGCHVLLQGIFPTQGLNWHLLRLLHCRQILYPLSNPGSLCFMIIASLKLGCLDDVSIPCQEVSPHGVELRNQKEELSSLPQNSQCTMLGQGRRIIINGPFQKGKWQEIHRGPWFRAILKS